MFKNFFTLFTLLFSLNCYSQNYSNVLNYQLNDTPINGVKIKTNLPFEPSLHMPVIHISGYSYGRYETIDLKIVFYIFSDVNDFHNPSKYYIHNSRISSAGGYTPTVYLSNENNKVVIYIADKVYYQRFTVSAFENLGQNNNWFQGWTVADETLNGTQTIEIPYSNRFSGDIFLSGNGVWNSQGNVGIGTSDTKGYKLAVAGKAVAEEITVKVQSNWPDYVFDPSFKLMPLNELKVFIDKNQHLPEIPSAVNIKNDGLHLGEMNQLLTKKVEELTLYHINADQKAMQQERELSNLKIQFPDQVLRNQKYEQRLHKLERKIIRAPKLKK
jgi:hypothetical protein